MARSGRRRRAATVAPVEMERIPEMRKAATPTKDRRSGLTEEVLTRIVRAMREDGCSYRTAAISAGVDYRRAHEWARKGKEQIEALSEFDGAEYEREWRKLPPHQQRCIRLAEDCITAAADWEVYLSQATKAMIERGDFRALQMARNRADANLDLMTGSTEHREMLVLPAVLDDEEALEMVLARMGAKGALPGTIPEDEIMIDMEIRK